MTQKEIKQEPVFIIDKIAGAKEEAKELGKKKYRHHKHNKNRGTDFDQIGSRLDQQYQNHNSTAADINNGNSLLPEITNKGAIKAAQSFVLMPVGANRKKLQ